MKKALAFVLMATLVLTSMSFSVMAEALTDVNTSEATTGFTSNPGTKTEVTVVTGVGGKKSTDSAFAFKMKDSSLAAASANYVQPLGNLSDKSKPNVYEMSFMLPNGSAGVNLPTQMWLYVNGSSTNSELTMSITPDGFAPAGNYSGVVAGTAFEYDKWYNLAIVFPYAGTENYGETMLVYVNGDLKSEIKNYHYQNKYRYVQGIRRIRMSPISGTNGTTYIYFDNLRQYAGTYIPANDAAATLTPVQDGKVATIANGRIGTTARLTADELISNITKDDDTNLRVYSANGALLSGTDIVADNSVLVAAASNGTGMERTYSYYTVAKDAVHLPGILDGTSDIASGTQTLVNVVDGTFGKTDKVYAFSSVGNAILTSTAGYHPEPFAIVQAADASQKMLELSFMLPQGSTGFGLTAHQWQGGYSTSNPEHTIRVSASGIRIDYESPTVFNYNFDYNKWYNIAIALPGKTDSESYGNRATLYVNGENVGSFAMMDTTGIRRLRIHALTSSDTANTFAYIDNLRMVDSVYNNVAYDAEDIITPSGFDVDAKKDKFYITADTTVSAVKSSISDINEDTEIIVLNANGEKLADNDTVTVGCTVVVAAKNGTDHVRTLSYYTVENIAEKFVIKTPVYSGEERTVNASFDTINNTGAPASVSAIMALYDYDGSLKKVTPVVCTTDANRKGSFADGITMTADDDDDYIKFMIWASTTGDITPKMADVVLFDK